MIETPDFEAVYRDDPDPYRVGSTWYEHRKLAILTAALTQGRYVAGWDPACGTGHLVAALVQRCDVVVGTDLAASAVAVAERWCAGRAGITLARHELPDPLPARLGPPTFDLMIISEFWYYLDAPTRDQALNAVLARAAPTVEIASVHWRHRPHDGYLSGAEVQQELAERLGRAGFTGAAHLEDTDFVLDVHRREGNT